MNYDNLSSIWQRIKDGSPEFWIKVRLILASLAIIALALWQLPNSIPGFSLPENVAQICTWVFIANTALTFLPSNKAK